MAVDAILASEGGDPSDPLAVAGAAMKLQNFRKIDAIEKMVRAYLKALAKLKNR